MRVFLSPILLISSVAAASASGNLTCNTKSTPWAPENSLSCVCDGEGCDMADCVSNCQCPDGGCNMPNCEDRCMCPGCDIPKCVDFCDSTGPAPEQGGILSCAVSTNTWGCACKGQDCNMSACTTTCACAGGGCDQSGCESDCHCPGGNCDQSSCTWNCKCPGGGCIQNDFCDNPWVPCTNAPHSPSNNTSLECDPASEGTANCTCIGSGCDMSNCTENCVCLGGECIMSDNCKNCACVPFGGCTVASGPGPTSGSVAIATGLAGSIAVVAAMVTHGVL